MPVPLKVPSVGESITEVEIGEWLKTEGTVVAADTPLVVIESEKASLEVPAPVSGTLTQILKKSGERASVGDVIGYMEEGKAQPEAPKAPPAPPEEKRETKQAEKPKVEARTAEPSQPTAEPGRRESLVPMSAIRRRIGERLVEAQRNAALLTTFNEIDMSALAALRKTHQDAFRNKHGVKLGITSFFVKAVIEGLKQIPQLNGEVRADNIVYRDFYDIGIAIGGGKGLVVPVLRNAERLGLSEIERAIADFAERAKENRLKPEELQGGTFTISNGGIYGSLLSTPIVNPPQSGVLGLHAITDRPVVRNGEIVARPMMYVALTYDHRIVDGREAVTFLKHIREFIEEPALLLLEI
jgi:2-oxoglutarate dehydrogenase E2 component (dihydrolipoamide succinyltransferase)